MKNTRRIIAILLALAMILSFAACGNGNSGEDGEPDTTAYEKENKTKVAVYDGAAAVGLSKLKVDRSYAYEVKNYSSYREIVPLIMNGEADIAAVPLNIAADLYRKTNGGIKLLAVTDAGLIRVLSRDDSVKSIADLKGKTVYTSEQGAVSDYIIRYLLNNNGLDPETDVDIQYKASFAELCTLMKESKADICIMPEPFVSKVCAADESIKKVAELTSEWNESCKTNPIQSCLIARKAFIEQEPETVTEFLDFTEISMNYVNNYIVASKFLVDEGYFDNSRELTSGVPGCKLIFFTGDRLKLRASENFKALFEADPESVGGEIPNDGIYYLP